MTSAKVIEDLKDFKNTEKTVAYFYINTDGSVVVRKSDDYIPTMIEIAGGRYVFKDLKNSEGNAPSVKLTMEEFYATAVDADYLIYNGTIDGQVSSLGDLKPRAICLQSLKLSKMEMYGILVKTYIRRQTQSEN
ncbi:MAG: ABC transporter substrate-binding protein [Dorea formicigenerans]